MTFKPFENSTDAISIGELSIENNEAEVSISGSLTLTRDKISLAQARELARLATTIVAVLESDSALPDQAEPNQTKSPTVMKNPFGNA